MKKLMIIAAIALAGCAKKPADIPASYVSPMKYDTWSCQQLAQESARVDDAYTKAATQQEEARSADTMGVILLGLPVSSLSGGNVAPQIASLKGEQEVLAKAMIRKNCTSS